MGIEKWVFWNIENLGTFLLNLHYRNLEEKYITVEWVFNIHWNDNIHQNREEFKKQCDEAFGGNEWRSKVWKNLNNLYISQSVTVDGTNKTYWTVDLGKPEKVN